VPFVPRDYLVSPSEFGKADAPTWQLTGPGAARGGRPGIDPKIQYAAALVAAAAQHAWARSVRDKLTGTSLYAAVRAGVGGRRLSQRVPGSAISTHYQRMAAWINGERPATAADVGTAMMLLDLALPEPGIARAAITHQVHQARHRLGATGRGTPLHPDLDIIEFAQGLTAGRSEAEARTAAQRPARPGVLTEDDIAWLETIRPEPAWAFDVQGRVEAALTQALDLLGVGRARPDYLSDVLVQPAADGEDVGAYGTMTAERLVLHATVPRNWPTDVLDDGTVVMDGCLVLDRISDDLVLAAALEDFEEEFVDEWGDWAPLGRQFRTRLYRVVELDGGGRLEALGADALPTPYGPTRPAAATT
jgi:hypothetical protein